MISVILFFIALKFSGEGGGQDDISHHPCARNLCRYIGIK